jgi:hypothetical protein
MQQLHLLAGEDTIMEHPVPDRGTKLHWLNQASFEGRNLRQGTEYSVPLHFSGSCTNFSTDRGMLGGRTAPAQVLGTPFPPEGD